MEKPAGGRRQAALPGKGAGEKSDSNFCVGLQKQKVLTAAVK